MLQFTRSHGLGNDYLVVDGRNGRFTPTVRAIEALCDRHRGVGSDGVLVRVEPTRAQYGVRIFNPDGSEAEKSGNGLRIFAHYIWTTSLTTETEFSMEAYGGQEQTRARLHPAGRGPVEITVEMGKATFIAQQVPTTIASGEAVNVPLVVLGKTYSVTAVSVGNPHCVLFVDDLDEIDLRMFGPAVESHPGFPNRTNVQVAQVIDSNHIKARIWERGAGYTLASGSSACAVAAAALRTGRTGGALTIHMPGGDLQVQVANSFEIQQRGPVEEIARGTISADLARAMGMAPQDPDQEA